MLADPQIFAYRRDCARNLLRTSSDTVSSMENRSNLSNVIARNATFLMLRQGLYDNPTALASAINTPTKKVAPNSIAYIFKPQLRPKGKTKDTLPRLEILAAAAAKLGCETWELLHPDLPALREKLAAYDAMVNTINRGKGGSPFRAAT